MNGHQAESVFAQSTRKSAAPSGSSRPRMNMFSRGQSAVEFALISAIVLALMLLGVQYALIGQAAVAVSQGSSALTRWVASSAANASSLGTYNGSMKASALPAGAQEVLSQSILTNGGNDLTVYVNSYTATGAKENSTPVAQVDQLVISLSYSTTSKLALPNPFLAVPPIFPGITFPANVGATG